MKINLKHFGVKLQAHFLAYTQAVSVFKFARQSRKRLELDRRTKFSAVILAVRSSAFYIKRDIHMYINTLALK